MIIQSVPLCFLQAATLAPLPLLHRSAACIPQGEMGEQAWLESSFTASSARREAIGSGASSTPSLVLLGPALAQHVADPPKPVAPAHLHYLTTLTGRVRSGVRKEACTPPAVHHSAASSLWATDGITVAVACSGPGSNMRFQLCQQKAQKISLQSSPNRTSPYDMSRPS